MPYTLAYVIFYTYLCCMKNYFTVTELTRSDVARQYGINNTPDATITAHLKELIEFLNPLIEAWGSAINVTSGYRCEKLNKKVGGASTSAHKYGYAADLVPVNGKRREFIQFVMNYVKTHNVPFDQCINEYNRWAHIGIKNRFGMQRKQIFTVL